jgi:CRP/FNR family transcriptional regulator, cyclic AMP receptor protein
LFKRNPKIERLAEVGLFRGCTRRQLHDVSKLTTEIDFASGTVLCREGEAGTECFVVLDGLATVTVLGRDVATLGPGSLVGELALLDGKPRLATVTAANDMRLLILSTREFEGLLAIPVVSRRILASVAAGLREANTCLNVRPPRQDSCKAWSTRENP